MQEALYFYMQNPDMTQRADAEIQEATENSRRVIQDLMALARFDRGSKEFWAEYIRLFAVFCGTQEAILVGHVDSEWKIAQSLTLAEKAWTTSASLGELATMALKKNLVVAHMNADMVLAVRIDVGPQEAPPVLLLNLGQQQKSVPHENALLFAASIPSIFQVIRQYRQARADVIFFAELLQLVGAIADESKFGIAAMRLCNETAVLFKCDQVSIGWRRPSGGVRLHAISNLESFEDRANAVWELEAVMEESIDQDAEIIWPSKERKKPLSRAHETYAGVRSVGSLLTLPIRQGEKTIAALTCERQSAPFTEEDTWRLRLLLEQCARWLSFLEDKDQWFGEKIRRRIFIFLEKLTGVEYAGLKVTALACILALGILFFGVWPYNVDNTFLSKADNVVHVSAPIDGFIERAPVQPGDLVEQGDTLVELDSRELLLEQASALAKLARHLREAEKAKAVHSLADMRIAQMKAEECEAELECIAFYLKNTKVLAPFAGVVVDGDLLTRIGAPIRRGEVLMKVASLESMSLEIYVEEQDIRHVHKGGRAEISFVGKPDLRYEVELVKIVPMANVDNGRNVFTVNARFLNCAEKWLRPGMSGVARINAGKRSLWWILTHEVIDYLRLKFWL
jgi:biotin carboxyl carrier protein